MNYSQDILLTSPLFTTFTLDEIQQVIANLPSMVKSFAKGATVMPYGTFTSQIGLVLSGEVRGQKISPTGHIYTATRFTQGGIFGDLLAASGTKSPVTLTARTPCQILYIAFPNLSSSLPAPLCLQLYANLLGEISHKYFALDRRVNILLLQSLRKKIAAYLLEVSAGGAQPFAIPYSRTALALHLGCERSALSREISRMAKEGLLETRAQHFTILQPEALQKLLRG